MVVVRSVKVTLMASNEPERPWILRELQRRDAADLCRFAAALRTEAIAARTQAAYERERAKRIREFAGKLCKSVAEQRERHERIEPERADSD